MRRSFSLPVALWREVEAYTEPGERSASVQECFRRLVAKRKRERSEGEE